MNIRYDETVHLAGLEDLPVCGTALVPVCSPELTDDPVNCPDCKALCD